MTHETANFIQDRALTLHYECRQYRATAPTARSWLRRAAAWALRHGHRQLAACLSEQERVLREAAA